jgi:histidinol phosphatase-like PHP family hydrolase
MWHEEAALILQANRSLTDLPSIGPTLGRKLREWIEEPPPVPQIPDIRNQFFTATEARTIVDKHLARAKRLKADLQMHTVWSDGSGTIEEMARAAAERRYEYIAITDHSKGLKIAGGIDERQLRYQAAEIEEVNAKMRREEIGVRVLRSIELNLDPEGRGDMERVSLDSLDLVLGCFHSSLRKKEDQTERYIAALRNPDVQILGHPRGRVYNFRLGLKANWERVFRVAAELDKAVEIDGYPDRQDLNLDLLRLVKKAGCRVSLGTDSHDPMQLRFMDYSLAAAFKAGLDPDRILNFLSFEELVTWVQSVRRRP